MTKISVLLPVKNGEKYISEALESILEQSYSNFELLIFDDYSTDHTIQIIDSYHDSRIKLYFGKEGYIANLNRGIEIAEGQYIARMDADDVMYTYRLENQLSIMENLQVDVCSSWITMFGEGLEPVLVSNNLEGVIIDPLRWMLYENFIAHPTTMLRRSFLMDNNIRYENYPHAEDYKFWFEIGRYNGVFYIDPEPALKYRISDDQVTRIHEAEMNAQSFKIRNEIYQYLLNQL